MTSSLLLHRTSPVAAALLNYRIVVKTFVLCYLCFVDWRDFCCYVFIFSVVVLVVVFAALVIEFCSMMYVILVALGFGALLCNHIGSLPIWLITCFSGLVEWKYSLVLISIKFFLFSKKKKV